MFELIYLPILLLLFDVSPPGPARPLPPGSMMPQMLPLLLLIGIPLVFYILSLRRVLEGCSPMSRTMPPYQMWFLLIPLFNIIWHFFVVSNLARSLANEFKSRNVKGTDPEPGKSVGVAMCILSVGSVIPVIGGNFFGDAYVLTSLATMLGLASFVCWVVYWAKIAGYSQSLRMLRKAGTAA